MEKYMTIGTTLFVTLICIRMASSVSVKCFDEMENEITSRENEMNYTSQMTYSLRPGWFAALRDAEDIPSKYIKIKQSKLHADLVPSKTLCRKPGKGKDRQMIDNTLNNLAECPWRFVENTDSSRIPKTILETECLCKTPVHAKKKDNLICQSVMEYISVYRKVDVKHGVEVFKRCWEPRSVACVASSLPKAQRKYIIDTKMTL